MRPALNTGLLRSQFLFGLIDGLNGAIGLMVALRLSNASAGLVVAGLLARAGASSVSMGGAEFSADEDVESNQMRWLRVAAMMSGYLLSALGAGIGFLWSNRLGAIIAVPASAIFLCIITWVRSQRHGVKAATAITLGIFGAAVTVGVLSSLVAP